MLDDMFVIDGVVHPFNFDPSNNRDGRGDEVSNLVWNLHSSWNPPELVLPKPLFMSEWTSQQLTDTLFKESVVDIAVNHHLPLYTWWKDGVVGRDKNVELAQRWPNRYILFAGVDPTVGVVECLDNLAAQIEETPVPLRGVKMYPTQLDVSKPKPARGLGPTRSFRMDDEDLLFPLYEKCLEYGIKTVAVHKAVPNGPIPINPFRVDDVDGAARAFPELNFEIIHSGLAFIDETAQAIGRFPNVYANFETTTMLLMNAPGWFEEIFALLAYWGGYEKLIFSSGTMYTHAQPILELIRDFRYSDATMEKYGLEQITKDDKARFLGLNYAEMLGLDVDELKRGIAGDEFQRYQQQNGLDVPFSNWKASRPDLLGAGA